MCVALGGGLEEAVAMATMTERASAEALDEMPTERLEAQICAMAARRAADECAWLLLIAEFDRREAYLSWECRSTSYWLSWHCGLSLSAGRERVRVARALEALPLVQAAFAEGRLTYSKVRAITRVASSRTERSLLDLGLAATAAQLERICSAYRRVDRPEDGDHATALAERQDLRTWHDFDGLTRIEADILPEDGALVEAAIAEAREQLRQAADTSGVSAETPTRVEALVEVARSYLAERSASPNVERRHLVVLVDVGELTANPELDLEFTGRCTLNGQRLTPETARELGCSTALTTILLDHYGLPLSVGRASRTATKAQRLALEIRDGGHCRYPGCASRYVDAHHIVEWEKLGPTDLANLVLLCRHHHRRIHHGGYTITLDPQTAIVEVMRPDGSVVDALDASPADAPDRAPIADRTLPPGEAGARLELDDIVECLAFEEQARQPQTHTPDASGRSRRRGPPHGGLQSPVIGGAVHEGEGVDVELGQPPQGRHEPRTTRTSSAAMAGPMIIGRLLASYAPVLVNRSPQNSVRVPSSYNRPASHACGVSIQRKRWLPASNTSPSANGRGGRSARSASDTMQPVIDCTTVDCGASPASRSSTRTRRPPRDRTTPTAAPRPAPDPRGNIWRGPVWNSSGSSPVTRYWLKLKSISATWVVSWCTPSAISATRVSIRTAPPGSVGRPPRRGPKGSGRTPPRRARAARPHRRPLT